MHYADAVAELFQAPLDQFVAERKRLAAELKTAGDKDGAAKLAKLARPPISAWAVNQLWWHARDAFDPLLATAERLRDGKLDAMAAHREAIAALRARAAQLLTKAEHGATEATLRRVTQTLSALAAAGNWEPDLPGTLSADRDPPGFEAASVTTLAAAVEAPVAKPAQVHAATNKAHTANDNTEADEAARRREQAAIAAKAEAAAEQRRAEARRAQALAERHRLEAALRTAHGDVAQRQREVAKLEKDLAAARGQVDHAEAIVADLEQRLAELKT